ncbi:MAG: internalization-related competence protein ComEC/Rec2 protein [Parcubacteria group bacterium GW2011_GWB1_43_8]|nr:MAG: internalization-related competence protein ComEC/Rec2 protein [Parcubacteria group bacterium GW2011_GWB1_43_8]
MRQKFLVTILSGFVSGVFVSSFIDFGWAFALLFIFLGLVFGIINYRHRTSIIAALFFVAVGFGQLKYGQSDLNGRQSDLRNKTEQRMSLVGIVSEEPEQKENYNRLVLKDEESEGKILVYLQNYPQYKYGDKLKINGILKNPESFSADFSWPAYLAKDGIYYEMFYPQTEFISSGNGFWLKEKLFDLKAKFLLAISKVVPEPHSAFLGGITIGARESLPKDLQEKFRTTGVAHIVALSGYNITIVAETIMLFFSFLPQYLAIGGGVIGVVLFAIMTGASATVLRASIMALLALTAKATGRIYTVSWALFLAGFFMVLQNPKILRFDTSFQLSFLATLGLIYISPIVKNKLVFVTDRFNLREIFSATISAQIAVLPLLVYKTGLVSLVGLPVNFLILPFIPLTMFLGFAVGIFGMISYFLSLPFAWASFILLQYELFIVDIFAKLPFSAVNIAGFSEIFLILSYTVIFFIVSHLHQKEKMEEKRTV